MDKTDQDKIEKIIADRNKAHRYYWKRSKVYQAFVQMEQAAYRDGFLDKKQKELIAIGISIVMNCESCMEWHIKQALDANAAKEEIIEAIEVGMEMGGGPATVSSRFAMKVLQYYSTTK